MLGDEMQYLLVIFYATCSGEYINIRSNKSPATVLNGSSASLSHTATKIFSASPEQLPTASCITTKGRFSPAARSTWARQGLLQTPHQNSSAAAPIIASNGFAVVLNVIDK
jgi:hypothetical protein